MHSSWFCCKRSSWVGVPTYDEKECSKVKRGRFIEVTFGIFCWQTYTFWRWLNIKFIICLNKLSKLKTLINNKSNHAIEFAPSLKNFLQVLRTTRTNDLCAYRRCIWVCVCVFACARICVLRLLELKWVLV